MLLKTSEVRYDQRLHQMRDEEIIRGFVHIMGKGTECTIKPGFKKTDSPMTLIRKNRSNLFHEKRARRLLISLSIFLHTLVL